MHLSWFNSAAQHVSETWHDLLAEFVWPAWLLVVIPAPIALLAAAIVARVVVFIDIGFEVRWGRSYSGENLLLNDMGLETLWEWTRPERRTRR